MVEIEGVLGGLTIRIIHPLYSWGSLFGVPIKAPLGVFFASMTLGFSRGSGGHLLSSQSWKVVGFQRYYVQLSSP